MQGVSKKTYVSKCICCGAKIETHHVRARYCSLECWEEIVGSQHRCGVTTPPKYLEDQDKEYEDVMEPTRVCHDCGKKTTDYRCPECWEKYSSKFNSEVREENDWLKESYGVEY